MDNLKLGIFASHGGSNLEAILKACKEQALDAVVKVVISNNSQSRALELANNEEINAYHLSSFKYKEATVLDDIILKTLIENDVDTIVLAGYMKKLGDKVLAFYDGRILNIHPSLLPKFGGKGMYGINVHKAVIESGDKRTGITVHLVDKDYDTGRILNQCEIDIIADETAESLAKKVLHKEHEFYVDTLIRISKGEIKLKDYISNCEEK